MNDKSIDEIKWNCKKISLSFEMREVRKERQMQQIENSKTVDSNPTVNNHYKCEWSECTLLKENFRLDKKARPESMSSTRNPL